MPNPFVLIVDDNPDTLNLLAQTLELEGIRVATARTVFRAVETLHDASERPALIITDLMMPQTTGWDLLKHLRADAALQSIPVVVVTGVEPGEVGALADVVLQKPVDPEKVAETVRSLMQSRQGAHPSPLPQT